MGKRAPLARGGRILLAALPWLFLTAALGVAGWTGWGALQSWQEQHDTAVVVADTTTITTTTAPTTTSTLPPETTTTTLLSGLEWAKVPVNPDRWILGGTGNQEISAVTAGGPGLVAVGASDGSAAVWTSADGEAWSRGLHDDVLFGGLGSQWMSGVVAAGPGLVAVGGSDDTAAVWTSTDGYVWTQVPQDPAVFGGSGYQEMSAVVVFGPGLVAVGSSEGSAAVWTSPDGLVWSRLPHEQNLGGPGLQEMNAVTVGGPGLVAVGTSDGDAAVWASANGVDWSRIGHDEALFGGNGTQSMLGVVAGGPGLVAVGFDDAGGDSDAAVWTSLDGIAWTRIPHNESLFGGRGNQALMGLAAGGPGLAAVGYDGSGADPDAAVWVSGDGLAWSKIPPAPEVLGGGDVQAMRAIIAYETTLVAVGYDDIDRDWGTSVPSADWDAAVWTSSDGAAWSRVIIAEGAIGSLEMLGVAVGGPGLVAVGYSLSGGGLDAAVWASVDGSRWARLPHDEDVLGGAAMTSVVAGGPGLVAVGANTIGEAQPGQPAYALVWTSPDGLTWSQAPWDESIAAGAALRSVAAGGPGLVAVGEQIIWEDGAQQPIFDALVWTSQDGLAWSRVPPDAAIFGQGRMRSVTAGGPGLVAVGSHAGRAAAVWTSEDGLRWSRVPYDAAAFASAEMTGVATGGPGLVAVGSRPVTGGGLDAAVWVSADGITWERIGAGAEVFGGHADQVMLAVTPGGPGLVAVGYAEVQEMVSCGINCIESRIAREAAVWVSPDGRVWSRVPRDEALFGGPGDQVIAAIVAGGPGLVGVGRADMDAATWVSRPAE